MFNQWIGIGRLTADPILRYTQTGKAVANFTLAVENRKDYPQFIDCVAWQKQAETIANYLAKGRMVAVTGELTIRSYEDRDGIRRRAAEVIVNNCRFLDWGERKPERETADEAPSWDDPDFDDLPF